MSVKCYWNRALCARFTTDVRTPVCTPWVALHAERSADLDSIVLEDSTVRRNKGEGELKTWNRQGNYLAES